MYLINLYITQLLIIIYIYIYIYIIDNIVFLGSSVGLSSVI